MKKINENFKILKWCPASKIAELMNSNNLYLKDVSSKEEINANDKYYCLMNLTFENESNNYIKILVGCENYIFGWESDVYSPETFGFDLKNFTKIKENTFVLEELNVDLRLPISYKIEDKNIRDITITEVFDLMLKNGFNIDTFDKYKNMINIRFLKEHTEVLFLFKNNKCVDFTSDGILPESLGIII